MRKLCTFLSVLVLTLVCSASAFAQLAAGDYIIKNVESGTYLGGANDWGTQASVVPHGQRFTVAVIEDGVYTLDSHTYNNATNHYLTAGGYVDGAATNLTITNVSDDIYTIAADGKYLTAGETACSYAEDATAAAAQWQFICIDDPAAVIAVGEDCSWLIKAAAISRNLYNKSFEAAWTVQGYDTEDVAGNYNLFGGNNANMCAESWKSSNGFNIFQTLTVPNGTYELKAQAACNDYDATGNVPVVYANDETATFNPITEGEVSMATMSTNFTAGMYNVEPITVTVEDNTLTVGVKCSNTNLWAIWDNFELTYTAAPVEKNWDFEADEAEAIGVRTYAKDVTGDEKSQCQEVTGWTLGVENGDARAAGTYAYGSEAYLGGAGYLAPETGANGEAGKALGLVSVWGADTYYTQKVTLPSGNYQLVADVYNAGGTAAVTNRLGANGVYSENTTYPVGEWTKETIAFALTEKTEIEISVGYKSNGGGSGSNPHLFYDNINIEEVEGSIAALEALNKEIATAEKAVASYVQGDGVFQYPATEFETINAAIETAKAALTETDAETINAATAALTEVVDAFAPKQTAPVAGVPYTITNVNAALGLNIATESVTIGQDANVYFDAVDGGYALKNDNNEYIFKTTANNWTLSTTTNIDEAYVMNVNTYDETSFTISGAKGMLGTDATTEGSAVYADKNASKNGVWTIVAGATPEYPTITISAPASTPKAYAQVHASVTEEIQISYEGKLASSDESFDTSDLYVNFKGYLINVTDDDTIATYTAKVPYNDPVYTINVKDLLKVGKLNRVRVLGGATVTDAHGYVLGTRTGATSINFNTIGAPSLQFIADNYAYGSGASITGYEFQDIVIRPYNPKSVAMNEIEGNVTVTCDGETVATVPVSELTLQENNDITFSLPELIKKPGTYTLTLPAELATVVYNDDYDIAYQSAETSFTLVVATVDTWANKYIAKGTVTNSEGYELPAEFDVQINGSAEAGYTVDYFLGNNKSCNYGGWILNVADETNASFNLYDSYGDMDLLGRRTDKDGYYYWAISSPDKVVNLTANADGTISVNDIVIREFDYNTYDYVTDCAATYTNLVLYPVYTPYVEPMTQPAFSELAADGETIYYLYNVESHSFVTGANDWGTRASGVIDKGNQFKISVNEEGTYKLSDLVGSNWSALDDSDGNAWVDGAGRTGDGTWTITANGDNTYSISNTVAAEGLKWGILLDLSDSRVYFRDSEIYGYTWAFVSEADYNTYMNAIDKDAINAILAENHTTVLNAQNADALAAMKALIDGTNITGEGFAEYVQKYEDYMAQFEAGTLTEAVVNPNSATSWHASTDYNFLLTPWTIGGNACDKWATSLYINTWSVEGDTDGSEFHVPFFEYWTGDANSLGANTISTTISDLTPGQTYEITAWVRVRIKNNVTDDATGITFQAGDGEAIDVCAGEQIGTSQFRIMEATATGVADESGNLVASFIVADDNNISWLSFKNVKYAEVDDEDVPTINIAYERVVNQGYTAEEIPYDEAAILDALKITSWDEITTMYPMDMATGEETTDYDGWRNPDGTPTSWGNNSFVCVKYPHDGSLTLCTMPGNEPEVGTAFNCAWILGTSEENKIVLYITVNFVDAAKINIPISDLEVKTSVEYASSEGSYTLKTATISADDITAICTELGIASLDEATLYGYNPTTEELISSYSGFDGWRDVNGDFATWTGNATVPACVKAVEGDDLWKTGTFNCYNITGTDAMTVKTYWAIATEEKAVLVEVDFIITAEDAINGIDATTAKANGKYLEKGKVVIYRDGIKYNVNGAVIK